MAQISIIHYNDILEAQRFDAEYFKKDLLDLQILINKHETKSISELGCKLDCSAFYPSITDDYSFESIGIPFLRVNEIQDGIVRITEKTAFLPSTIIEKYSSNIKIAYPGDLIIAKGGNSLAKVGLLTEAFEYYAVCRDLIIIRTQNIVNINRYYLWLFLHSEIGQKIMLRTASQTGQPHLTINEIKNITIPVQENFNSIYEDIFMKSSSLEEKSKKLFEEAEYLLLSELDLIDYKPEHKLTFEVTSSKVVQVSRFDAEYFQPKYEETVEHIENYHNGFDSVKNIIEFNNTNYKPEDNRKYRYIALADISSQGYVESYDERLGKDLPSRARRKVKTNDVIISSIEGSLSSCAIIEEEHNEYLCSTGFYVMHSEVLTPEVLLVLFKSDIIQNLLKRGSNGTILAAITKAEIEQLVLPLIDTKVQAKISDNIKTSSKLRKESKNLLELAKKSIEIAIEESEDKAINLINMYNKT